MSCRVAIIGGGPGGLMTAYQLQQRCSTPFETTIYEASGRLGGKVLTPRFAAADVSYEAGAAELYDYSHVGEDPLRELVQRLGLKTRPMNGASILLQDQVLADLEDVGRIHGEATQRALMEFDTRAKRWMNPQEFYDSDWRESNVDPMAHKTFEEEIAQVPDATARQFLRTMVHSDVATEPHCTSASYGLQNYLMNDPAYMTLYSIEGGVERLTQELAARVNATVRLHQPVVRVERCGQLLQVSSRPIVDGQATLMTEEFDFVAVALPNYFLPAVEWAGEPLGEAMRRHHIHYDYPAHYLRISVLFREVFWRDHLKDSYFMLDAFGGCCLYDESSRGGSGDSGVLGWLLAGDAAMTASNRTDDELIAMVLDSLPAAMQQGREMFVEGRVHRWIGAVNGLPGGKPALDMESRHTPELTIPNLFVVGDYLFDSTLNGVLDSADYVAESIAEEMSARPTAPSLHSAVA
jgi:monoamine oxidase